MRSDEIQLTEVDLQWLKIRFRLQLEKIKNSFTFLRNHNIEPILIKGWSVGRFYPEPFKRITSDVDLAIAPEAFGSAFSLAADGKLEAGVDLHNSLRHLDTLEWSDLFSNSVLVDLEGVEIRLLCPEDNLRVVAIHWLNDGGGYKDKLLDIVHLLNENRARFNWDRCLDVVSATRRTWILKTIGLASLHFGLDLEGFPYRDEMLAIPSWLTSALEREWRSGVRLKPLHMVLGDKRELWAQIRKRIPPNAIQASIELEAPFDDSSRIRYQLSNTLRRIAPSLIRIGQTIPDRGSRENG